MTPRSASRRKDDFAMAMLTHEEEEHAREAAAHEEAREEAARAIRETKEAELAQQMKEEHTRLDHLRKKGFSGFDPYSLSAAIHSADAALDDNPILSPRDAAQ
eukprot:3941564-Rhodomonas_salina.1